jgi:hypothetical protein
VDLLIKHDGHAFLISDPDTHVMYTALSGTIDDMTFVCHPNGTVDITTSSYQGFGSWTSADSLLADMRSFFYDNIDEDLFNDDSGLPNGRMLAESTADAHDLYMPDGTLPTWLIDDAEAIVVEWREANGI